MFRRNFIQAIPALLSSVFLFKSKNEDEDNKETMCILEGDKYFIKNGEIVRVELTTGTIKTYKDGDLHSYNDEPAVQSQRHRRWHKNGVLHRENDLPAIQDDCFKSWFLNGKYCRRNGMPTRELSDGFKYWHDEHDRIVKIQYPNGDSCQM